MSELAVSNDVSSESLWPPAATSLRARLQQHASAGLRTLERWQGDALLWFSERAPWQRAAISLSIGALLGVGIVLVAAGIVHGKKAELRASATPVESLMLQAAPSAVTPLAPPAAPVAAATPAPSLIQDSTAPAPSLAAPVAPAPEQLLEKPATQRASKPAIKKRSRERSHARSGAATWTFPRPQRR